MINMSEKISVRLFGKLIRPYIDYFDGLKQELRRAQMSARVDEYMCDLILYAFIVFAASLVTLSVFLSLLIKETVFAYTLSILISFGATAMTFIIGYYYPSLQAKSIKKNIDKSLPFAVSYMATSASSGINPIEVFKMLSLRGGTLGKEAKKIYTNVKGIGMDLTAVLQKTASRTPSETFSDLLWGMVSVITTGGNMESYLRGKARTYMTHYRRALNDYAKQITLYTEIYVTLIIVGSLFFIVLIAIIAPLTGAGTDVMFLQTFLVFFFIPVISGGFIFLLKGISPTE